MQNWPHPHGTTPGTSPFGATRRGRGTPLRGRSSGGGRVYRAARLARTLWYVPPGQLTARLGYILRTYYYRSLLWGLGQAVGGAPAGLPAAGGVRPPWLIRGRLEVGEAIAQGSWPLVGTTLSLPLRPGRTGARQEWQPARATALWVFTLHYFEWLADLREAGARETAQILVRDWLESYDQRWHPVAWHPYPLSLRLVSWLTHAEWLLNDAEPALVAAFWASVHRQAAFLARNTEVWLGGNHLIKNLRALVTAGCCLPGGESWLRQGLAGLLRQLPVQIHPDGGHYEASPSYHVQVLEDLVAVALLLKKHSAVPPVLQDVVQQMVAALAVLRQPDGTLGLFNDGATDVPARLEDLLARARSVGGAEIAEPVALPDTGYVRLVRGEGLNQLTLLADAGRIGPDENPGHAHADTLSFELSVGAAGGVCERVVVNSGTYAYQDRQRNVFRGTAAHSTLSVDGSDSAEVWGGFRVGRRPVDVGFELKNPTAGDAVLAGWHDGYRHLGVEHRRQWLLAADGSRLRGQDDVLPFAGLAAWRRGGWRSRRLVAHFPLYPGVQVTLPDDQQAWLVLPSGRLVQFNVLSGGRLSVREGWYAPQFGHKEPTQVLTVVLTPPARGQPRAQLGWEMVLPVVEKTLGDKVPKTAAKKLPGQR